MTAHRTGRYAYRVGWNQYGSAAAEELSSVPLVFEMMPAMLKRGGYMTHMVRLICHCVTTVCGRPFVCSCFFLLLRPAHYPGSH